VKRLRGKLTYSNVMVTVLAVLVIGGGTAYAATEMLPKGSVGTKQIQKEAVTPAKLSKASKAALTGPAGPKGATGPQGVPGPQGTPGQKGDPGVSATALWAEVNGAGAVVKGSGVTGAHTAGGGYEVDFNRDVTACTYQATSAEYPAAIILAEPRVGSPDGVFVAMEKVYEGPAIPGVFFLAVFC
jgi:hypothetical protein